MGNFSKFFSYIVRVTRNNICCCITNNNELEHKNLISENISENNNELENNNPISDIIKKKKKKLCEDELDIIENNNLYMNKNRITNELIINNINYSELNNNINYSELNNNINLELNKYCSEDYKKKIT